MLARKQNSRCARCGLMIQPGEPTHLDHFVPLAKGGTNAITNLRLTHATCNLAKADHLP